MKFLVPGKMRELRREKTRASFRFSNTKRPVVFLKKGKDCSEDFSFAVPRHYLATVTRSIFLLPLSW